jgi:hypothetical protein
MPKLKLTKTVAAAARPETIPYGTPRHDHTWARFSWWPTAVPLKIGMVLTAHKTVTMFMRYIHTENNRVRAAADADSRGGTSSISPPSAAKRAIRSTPRTSTA